ncbi:hypothetical protein HAX54_004551 [Datura stramonium]|uniref:CRIB domain-containing protein n=1 Tax=Datura stramonium TaxID=4076 RepID=A0ABS8WW11_DATST|nr:hypothetical protein [Datura stramonium]
MQPIQQLQTQTKETETQRGFSCCAGECFRRKKREKTRTGMTGLVMVSREVGCGNEKSLKGEQNQHHQLCLLDFLLAALRKSMGSCRFDQKEEVKSAVHHMEIGWPTNVQHLTHVTFDRFHGFLGLPVEFEVEVPCKAPSASKGTDLLQSY